MDGQKVRASLAAHFTFITTFSQLLCLGLTDELFLSPGSDLDGYPGGYFARLLGVQYEKLLPLIDHFPDYFVGLPLGGILKPVADLVRGSDHGGTCLPALLGDVDQYALLIADDHIGDATSQEEKLSGEGTDDLGFVRVPGYIQGGAADSADFHPIIEVIGSQIVN